MLLCCNDTTISRISILFNTIPTKRFNENDQIYLNPGKGWVNVAENKIKNKLLRKLAITFIASHTMQHGSNKLAYNIKFDVRRLYDDTTDTES